MLITDANKSSTYHCFGHSRLVWSRDVLITLFSHVVWSRGVIINLSRDRSFSYKYALLFIQFTPLPTSLNDSYLPHRFLPPSSLPTSLITSYLPHHFLLSPSLPSVLIASSCPHRFLLSSSLPPVLIASFIRYPTPSMLRYLQTAIPSHLLNKWFRMWVGIAACSHSFIRRFARESLSRENPLRSRKGWSVLYWHKCGRYWTLNRIGGRGIIRPGVVFFYLNSL